MEYVQKEHLIMCVVLFRNFPNELFSSVLMPWSIFIMIDFISVLFLSVLKYNFYIFALVQNFQFFLWNIYIWQYKESFSLIRSFCRFCGLLCIDKRSQKYLYWIGLPIGLLVLTVFLIKYEHSYIIAFSHEISLARLFCKIICCISWY